jgi:hypothetical protein
VSTRQILGLAAAACLACCIGPILGVLAAIAALGLVSSLFIGAAALVVAAAAVAAFIACDGVGPTLPRRGGAGASWWG